MKFTETKIKGVFLIDLTPVVDDRGFFSRIWCVDEFRQHGIDITAVQTNISFNHKAGTLRGLHFQHHPYWETKLVRCVQGRVYDAVVDVRLNSPTFGEWVGVELTAENRRAIYMPTGIAHGYQALTDGAEVLYQMGQFYHGPSAASILWNDPAIGIEWPIKEAILSPKDTDAVTLDVMKQELIKRAS